MKILLKKKSDIDSYKHGGKLLVLKIKTHIYPFWIENFANPMLRMPFQIFQFYDIENLAKCRSNLQQNRKIGRKIGRICTRGKKKSQNFQKNKKKLAEITSYQIHVLPYAKYGYFWKLPFWVRVCYIRKTYGTFLQFRSIYYEVTS